MSEKTPGTFEEWERGRWCLQGKTRDMVREAWDACRASRDAILARYSNPWTIQIQRKSDGCWIEFCHDAPITLEEAERREDELKSENPQVVSRIVPWLNSSQAQHVRASHDAEVQGLVKMRIGESCLTRDLVWCECGRGISRYGFWTYCPNCGGKIDQESYRAACEKAKANAATTYLSPEQQLEIAREHVKALTAERDTLAEKMERAVSSVAHFTHHFNKDLKTFATLREHVKALREALVESRQGLVLSEFEFDDPLVRKIDAALALTEAPTEAMVEDEHGECPNCANPPHVGPCRRKQPKDLAGASALPPCPVPGGVDWWKGVAQQMGLRIFVAEKALREIALNHAEPARSGVTKALNALNGEFPDAVGHVPSEAPQEKP